MPRCIRLPAFGVSRGAPTAAVWIDRVALALPDLLDQPLVDCLHVGSGGEPQEPGQPAEMGGDCAQGSAVGVRETRVSDLPAVLASADLRARLSPRIAVEDFLRVLS